MQAGFKNVATRGDVCAALCTFHAFPANQRKKSLVTMQPTCAPMLDACIAAHAPQTFWTTYVLCQHGAGNSRTACNGMPSKQVRAKPPQKNPSQTETVTKHAAGAFHWAAMQIFSSVIIGRSCSKTKTYLAGSSLYQISTRARVRGESERCGAEAPVHTWRAQSTSQAGSTSSPAQGMYPRSFATLAPSPL